MSTPKQYSVIKSTKSKRSIDRSDSYLVKMEKKQKKKDKNKLLLHKGVLSGRRRYNEKSEKSEKSHNYENIDF